MIKPDTFVVEITTKCNLNCKHCSLGGGRSGEHLPFKQIKNIIEKISALGTSRVILTGGEPLLHPHILDICRLLNRFCIHTAITTNGILLGSEEKIEALYETGVRYIQISVDGLKSEHDYMRGQGTFDKAKASIVALKKKGFFVNSMTVLSRRNYQSLAELINFLFSIGVDLAAFERMTPIGNAKANADLLLDKYELFLALRELDSLKKTNNIAINDPLAVLFSNELRAQCKSCEIPFSGCLSGIRNWAIDINGSLKLCTRLDKAFGKFLDVDWSMLFDNKDIQSLIFRNLDGECKVCEFRNACGGCRAHASSEGHFLDQDPDCFKTENYYINFLENR